MELTIESRHLNQPRPDSPTPLSATIEGVLLEGTSKPENTNEGNFHKTL